MESAVESPRIITSASPLSGPPTPFQMPPFTIPHHTHAGAENKLLVALDVLTRPFRAEEVRAFSPQVRHLVLESANTSLASYEGGTAICPVIACPSNLDRQRDIAVISSLPLMSFRQLYLRDGSVVQIHSTMRMGDTPLESWRTGVEIFFAQLVQSLNKIQKQALELGGLATQFQMSLLRQRV